MHSVWVSLIDSTGFEIHRQARDLQLAPEVRAYAGVLSAYLQGDVEKLERVIAEIESAPLEWKGEIRALANFRLGLRKKSLKAKAIEEFASLKFQEVFSAEQNFCLGLAWESAGNDLMAEKTFHEAARLYRATGCERKALRAHYNALAADSRVNPHKNFIAEYQAVIEVSRRLNESIFEGMALIMLSREYQVAGLYDQSLTMIERSIEQLEPERGTLHYYYALLQKAHVLIDLERTPAEIAPILKECEMAPFKEAAAIRRLLTIQIDPQVEWDSASEADLPPSWRNRLPKLTVRSEARGHGDLEEKFLRFAYNGPVEKWDLIQKLYPESTPALVLENRFKNLVARLRKKYPGEIICQDGRYSIAKMPAL